MNNPQNVTPDDLTVREQAKYAAQRTLGAGPPLGARIIANACAEAASDVWEPIVRDLVKVAEHLRVTANDGVYDHAIAQAKEALG